MNKSHRPGPMSYWDFFWRSLKAAFYLWGLEGHPGRVEGVPWEGPLGEQFPGFGPACKNDDIKASRKTTGAPFFARELGGYFGRARAGRLS